MTLLGKTPPGSVERGKLIREEKKRVIGENPPSWTQFPRLGNLEREHEKKKKTAKKQFACDGKGGLESMGGGGGK